MTKLIQKQVNKRYIYKYNDAGSVNTIADRLWLLSCSEIWSGGAVSGGYGRAITKEGEQYKYYKDINAVYSQGNTKLIKISGKNWWLRSPTYNSYGDFCTVHDDGQGYKCDADNDGPMVSPGFSI